MQRRRSASAKHLSESTRTRAVAPLLACALLSGCLVTNELDFEPNRNAPRAWILSPEPVTRVTEQGDQECQQIGGGRGLEFRAAYYDLDVEQLLYVRPFVNGSPEDQLVVEPSTMGDPLHTLPRPLCIDLNRLTRACNRVQLFVYDNPRNLPATNTTELPDDVDTVEWIVIGPAGDSVGGAGKPEAQPSDCLADGGT